MVTVVKRDGREVRFDANKIKDAVYAAAKATKHIEISHELNMAMFIAQKVAEAVTYDINTFPPENNKITVEEIQDMVEEELMPSLTPRTTTSSARTEISTGIRRWA